MAEMRKKLVSSKESLLAQIEKHRDARGARSVIEDRALAFKKGWSKASIAMKKRLMRRLVDSMIYTQDGLKVFYVTAKDGPSELFDSKTKMASESDSGAIPYHFNFQGAKGRRPTGFFRPVVRLLF